MKKYFAIACFTKSIVYYDLTYTLQSDRLHNITDAEDLKLEVGDLFDLDKIYFKNIPRFLEIKPNGSQVYLTDKEMAQIILKLKSKGSYN